MKEVQRLVGNSLKGRTNVGKRMSVRRTDGGIGVR